VVHEDREGGRARGVDREELHELGDGRGRARGDRVRAGGRAGELRDVLDVGTNPIVTLEKQLLNMIGNLV
jgi:hypothetical protein